MINDNVRREIQDLSSGSRPSRREFKTYAAAHDLKLNKLLALCSQTYRQQHGE
jgi:hypothetical protein